MIDDPDLIATISQAFLIENSQSGCLEIIQSKLYAEVLLRRHGNTVVILCFDNEYTTFTILILMNIV